MFVVGFATKEEIEELEKRGWEVEPAEKYNLIGDSDPYLMEAPKSEDTKAIVIWVDSSVFDVMSGPDWEK
jgi:hypothetical protein